MKRRLARRGPNAGSYFWGCAEYPECRETYNDAGATRPEVVVWVAPALGDAYRKFIPAAVALEGEVAAFTYACLLMEEEPTGSITDNQALTALHVVRKILGRGHAPPPESQLLADLAQVTKGCTTGARQTDLPDSLFWLDHTRFGRHLSNLHFDVPMENLVRCNPQPVGRADWVLFPPCARGAGLVCGSGESLYARSALEAAGHTVIDPTDHDGLSAYLEGLAPFEIGERHLSAAVQTAAALVELLEWNMLPTGARSWTIGLRGPYIEAMQAGGRYFLRLVRSVALLYQATSLLAEEVAWVTDPEEPADLWLWWDDELSWFQRPCHRGPRSVELRPTWLPGICPLSPSVQDWARPDPEVPRDVLLTLLRACFPRYSDFWYGQEESLRRMLGGQDTLVLLPTGAGKSLIYQLAGMLSPGLTIVVAPLVSLIEDQLDNLGRSGIDRATAITSSTTARGLGPQIEEDLVSGAYFLVYVSPERLQIAEFRQSIRSLREHIPIPLVVVDEAHCVSEWGHDFRVAYLNVGRVSRRLAGHGNHPPTLVGLTGTASKAVLRDLLRELDIKGTDAVISPPSFDRPELNYLVIRCKTAQKRQALVELINDMPASLNVSPERLLPSGRPDTACGIVFCPHVKGEFGVHSIAAYLERRLQTKVGSYAGGFSAGEKCEVAADFKENRCSLLVATKAFGMGIDKPNVRYTIHLGLPNSLESFYQEAGRAGRDRSPSRCVVLASLDPKTETLLDPGIDVERVSRALDQIPGRDDTLRTLFFHTQAFRGITHELECIEQILERFSDLRRADSETLEFADGQDRSRLEKGLHRLSLLGLVEDYVVGYSDKCLFVERASADPARLKHSLVQYVAGYSRGRSRAVESTLSWSPQRTLEQNILGYCRVLIEFIYATVEAARRTAIREIVNWARYGHDDESLRRALLNYLRETAISEQMQALLRGGEFDLERWGSLLAGVQGAREIEEAEAGLARLLEDFPDHPTLLAARAVVLATQERGGEAIEFANAAVKFYRERYQGEASWQEFLHWLVGQLKERDSGLPWDRLVYELVAEEKEDLCRELLAVDLPEPAHWGTLPQLLRLLNQRVVRLNRDYFKVDAEPVPELTRQSRPVASRSERPRPLEPARAPDAQQRMQEELPPGGVPSGYWGRGRNPPVPSDRDVEVVTKIQARVLHWMRANGMDAGWPSVDVACKLYDDGLWRLEDLEPLLEERLATFRSKGAFSNEYRGFLEFFEWSVRFPTISDPLTVWNSMSETKSVPQLQVFLAQAGGNSRPHGVGWVMRGKILC